MDDPFSIPITIFRYTGYQLPVNLQECDGQALLSRGYTFRLQNKPYSFG